MGWRLSLRTPARFMLFLSAAASAFFSKTALSQCNSRGESAQIAWTIALLHALGLSFCALPHAFRHAAAAMRAGRSVTSFAPQEPPDPLDPTRFAGAFDFARVVLFGAIRCIACVLGLAGLQMLHLSQFLCLKSLLFVFVSLASHFRRKNFFRFHVAGAILGVLGASLVCASVALDIARADQPVPCAAPADPNPKLLGAMPLIFGAVFVVAQQVILAALYCLEETFLSRIKMETQFFMGLQGVSGFSLSCLCSIIVYFTPVRFSQDSGTLSVLWHLCHENVLDNFSLIFSSLPLAICCGVIVISSCLSVVFCIITTQHVTPSWRLLLELSKIIFLWAFGVYLSSSTISHRALALPSETWSPQSIFLAVGLFVASVAQAIYHRAFDVACFVYPTKWTLLELRDLHVLPQICGFEEPWHLGDAAERWRVAHYQRQERTSTSEASKRRTVRFKPGPALYEICSEDPLCNADRSDDFIDGASQAAEVKRIRAGYYSRIGVNRGASPTFDVRGGEDAIEGSDNLTQPLLSPQQRSD